MLMVMQRSFESEFNCTLPWRGPGTTGQCTKSEVLKDFKDLYYDLADASPNDVYERTGSGCYYKCTYPVRSSIININKTIFMIGVLILVNTF